MPEFNHQRLTVARERRELSKRELAERAGLHVRTIVGLEGGEHPAGEDTIAALVRVLRFPREFFFAGDITAVTADGASFRALTRMTAPRRDAVLAAGSLAFELSRYVDARFDLPAPNVPDLRGMSAEAASAALRAHWTLGEKPIRSVVHLLELHGVRVFSLAEDCVDVDAFSTWFGGRPFVFLNTLKSGERGRFDGCHELGHLVLHRHGSPQGREAEVEADRFASSFLMPAGSVKAVAPRFPTLDALVRIKTRWGVSVGALARRLSDLDLLSEWQYRQFCIAISARGWRTEEPNGAPRETSQIWQKVMHSMRGDGSSLSDVARELHIPTKDLEALVFQLVLHSVDGGRRGSGERRSHGHRRNEPTASAFNRGALRVVK